MECELMFGNVASKMKQHSNAFIYVERKDKNLQNNMSLLTIVEYQHKDRKKEQKSIEWIWKHLGYILLYLGSLDNNLIGDAGGKAIGDALGSNRCLQEL